MQKWCPSCQTSQDVSAFFKNRCCKDGYNWICKTCSAKRVNVEKARIRYRRYNMKRPGYRGGQQKRRRWRRCCSPVVWTSIYKLRPDVQARTQRQKQQRGWKQDYQRRKVAQQASRRRRYWAHHAQSLIAMSTWRKQHPEQGRSDAARRRARRKAAPLNDFTAAQWKAMKEHYGHRCVYCGRKMKHLTQDHIISLAKGGSHTLSNIIPACRSCNSRKGTKNPPVPVQPLLLL